MRVWIHACVCDSCMCAYACVCGACVRDSFVCVCICVCVVHDCVVSEPVIHGLSDRPVPVSLVPFGHPQTARLPFRSETCLVAARRMGVRRVCERTVAGFETWCILQTKILSGRMELGHTSGPVCHMNTPPRSGEEIARTVPGMETVLLEEGPTESNDREKRQLTTATEYNTDNSDESKGENAGCPDLDGLIHFLPPRARTQIVDVVTHMYLRRHQMGKVGKAVPDSTSTSVWTSEWKLIARTFPALSTSKYDGSHWYLLDSNSRPHKPEP